MRTGMASAEVGVVAGGSGGSASRREREREAAGGSGSGVVGDGGRQLAADGHVGCRLHFVMNSEPVSHNKRDLQSVSERLYCIVKFL